MSVSIPSTEQLLSQIRADFLNLIKTAAIGDMTAQTSELVVVEGPPKFQAADVDETPSAELARDAEAHALESSLTAHSMVSAAEALVRRVLALKVRAAVDDSHRSQRTAGLLRAAFASRRAATTDALAGAAGDLDDVMAALEAHLDGSLEDQEWWEEGE